MSARKRKAEEDLSKNPNTVKSRKRLNSLNDDQKVVQRARSAFNTQVSREKAKVKKSDDYRKTSDAGKECLLKEAYERVKAKCKLDGTYWKDVATRLGVVTQTNHAILYQDDGEWEENDLGWDEDDEEHEEQLNQFDIVRHKDLVARIIDELIQVAVKLSRRTPDNIWKIEISKVLQKSMSTLPHPSVLDWMVGIGKKGRGMLMKTHRRLKHREKNRTAILAKTLQLIAFTAWKSVWRSHISTLFTKIYFQKHHKSRLDSLAYASIVHEAREIYFDTHPRMPHVARKPQFPRKLAFDKVLLLSLAAQDTRRYYSQYVPGWSSMGGQLFLDQYFPELKVSAPLTPELITPEELGVCYCLTQVVPSITTFKRRIPTLFSIQRRLQYHRAIRTTGVGRLQRLYPKHKPFLSRLSLHAKIREIIGWGTRAMGDDQAVNVDGWVSLPGPAEDWVWEGSSASITKVLSEHAVFPQYKHQKALDLVLRTMKAGRLPKGWESVYFDMDRSMRYQLAMQ